MLLVENLFVILARESKRREVLDDYGIFVGMRLIVRLISVEDFMLMFPSMLHLILRLIQCWYSCRESFI